MLVLLYPRKRQIRVLRNLKNKSSSPRQRSLQKIPNECDFLDTLAELRFRQKRVPEAIRLIRQALAQTTDRGQPMCKGKRQYLEKQLKRFEKIQQAQSGDKK